MKIAVVCANGKAGKLIVKEAVERGLDVTAVVRGENQSVATKVIQKDLPQHSTSLKHLCDILSGTDIRLCIVGGAGSLYVNPEHTLCVADGTDFPDIFKPLASAMAKALKELRKRYDVKWTYVSPAGDFQAEGERTGAYISGGEELTLNEKGVSVISYADYAIAMVDEIVSGNHLQERISVVQK